MKLNILPSRNISRTYSFISLLIILPIFFTTYVIRYGEFLVGIDYLKHAYFFNIGKEFLFQLSVNKNIAILSPMYQSLNFDLLTIPVSFLLFCLMIISPLIFIACLINMIYILIKKSPSMMGIKIFTKGIQWLISLICWVCLIQNKPQPPKKPVVEFQAELLQNHSRPHTLFKILLIFPHVVLISCVWLALPILPIINHLSVLISGKTSNKINRLIIGFIKWSINVWAYFPLCLYDRYPTLKIKNYFKPLQSDLN
ncbi:MAG TPA: hypothetical protein QF353_06210 [Gammaproteobacteria bacterium]|nr:hypothetical protein [Gammaproteobacteria bacterium]